MALTATVEPAIKNVRLETTAPAGAATLTISRVGPSGTPATVRGWDPGTVEPGTVIARDFEAPIGVPLTYTATSYNSGGTVLLTETVTLTVPSDGCSDTWLNDLARSGNTMRIVIEALPELAYPVPATVHEIITRRAPIVASDIAHTPAFELSFLTDTDDQREIARSTLGNGIPVLLRTPPEDGIGNLYFAVLGYAEQRIVSSGTEPARRFVVDARQIERPDPELFQPFAPVTYQSVKDRFATYQQLKDERASYDAVAYDWEGAEAQDIYPWLPADV